MNRISLLIIGIVISACSSGGDDPVDTPKENQAPSKVGSLTYPTNNLLCITNIMEFQWGTSTDPDGDRVSYTLDISKDNLFSTIAESFTVTSNSKTITLEKGVAYYWRVKALDNKNLGSDYSDTYQFYTEGEGETNHLPFTPKLISPDLDTSVSGISTNLQWNCSDVDNDSLIYDVYFDTMNPPVNKVGENLSDKTFNVSLNATTTYYWKVIAKDNNGGQSIGQIWSFTTN
jgi:hypothetical protein